MVVENVEDLTIIHDHHYVYIFVLNYMIYIINLISFGE